jgi:parallel beta-helix repeat protein
MRDSIIRLSALRRRSLPPILAIALVVMLLPPPGMAEADIAAPEAGAAMAAPGAPPLGSISYPIPAGALFVSPSGSDGTADGSLTRPYRTLQAAADASPSGATIVLRRGTYREQTTWFGKKLTVQPYPGEEVWLSGSVPVTGWVRDGSIWRKDGWTAKFQQGGVDPRLIDPAYPYAAHPDLLFVDGEPLRQVGSRHEVGPGRFAVDYNTQQLFMGDDPTGKLVEGAVHGESIYVNKGHGSVVQGLGFRHFATHRSRIAAVKAFADDLIIRHNVIEGNAAAGLGVQGTNVIVEKNTLANNGQTGMAGWRSDGLRVLSNHLVGNNFAGFRSEYGGMKVTATHDILVSDNLAESNSGPGFWLDESVVGATVIRNTSRDNSRHGIFFELSTRAVVASNVVTGNGTNGIYVLGSDHVDIYNNTLVDNNRHINIIEDHRTIEDPTMAGHDSRFPRPQPGLTWDIHDVVVRNNILSGGRATTMASVDDTDQQRSGWDMTVSFDHNAYHRASSATPRWVLAWSNWPSSMLAGTTLAQVRQQTGQEGLGLAFDDEPDPFFTDHARQDWRLRADSPARGAGATLPAHVAETLGLSTSAGRDLGALHLEPAVPTPSQPVAAPKNTSPSAAFAGKVNDLTVSFDASSSHDPDGSIVEYAWRFGDGRSSFGKRVAHTYETAGTYTVQLRVTDDRGATDSHTAQVTVTAPSAPKVQPAPESKPLRTSRGCEGPAYAFAGDWDGSGADGLGWWCDGRTRLRTSSGKIHSFNYGRPGDVPVVADWNGDDRDTVSVIRDGTWHINNRLRGGPSERTFVYGRVSRGDVPIAGSWDRGRRELPGIVRDRAWHLRNSQSGGHATTSFVYGRLTAGDLPLWGDWNGNGRDTAGIVRNGTWHLRNSNTGGSSDITFVYGRILAGDRPVVGDWTGDGRDTAAIVRGSEWHLRLVHAGGAADQTIHFPQP